MNSAESEGYAKLRPAGVDVSVQEKPIFALFNAAIGEATSSERQDCRQIQYTVPVQVKTRFLTTPDDRNHLVVALEEVNACV